MVSPIDQEIYGLIKKTIMNMPNVLQMDKDYILAGRWRCDDSPTDAHHWIESDESGAFVCRYCHKSRRFERGYKGRKFQI